MKIVRGNPCDGLWLDLSRHFHHVCKFQSAVSAQLACLSVNLISKRLTSNKAQSIVFIIEWWCLALHQDWERENGFFLPLAETSKKPIPIALIFNKKENCNGR